MGRRDTGSGAACYWDGTSQGITKPPPGPVPCSSPEGYWSNSYNCYIRHVDPQPPAGDPFWQGPTWLRRGLQLLPTADRDADQHLGAGPRRRTLARGRHLARWRRSRSSRCTCQRSISASPPSLVRTASVSSACRCGCGRKAPNGHTFGPITESASAGGITITATAEVLHVTWDMGDGTEVVCDTAGTPYKPEYGRKDSPDCGHTYQLSSVRETDDAYTVTATSSWVITWAGAGQTGTIRLDGLNRSTQIRIGEAQVLVN